MFRYWLAFLFLILVGSTCFAESNPTSTSRAVLFVVDKSGSMGGQKIVDAKSSAKAASQEAIRRGAKVGVLTFSGDCSGSDMLTLPFTSSQAKVNQFIDRIDTGGGTPLAPAIKEASRIFRSEGIEKDRAITVILADGDDDCGGVDGALTELKNHNFLNRHETVGLEVSSGSTAQRQLEQIANATGGTYQASANSNQLEQVLINAVSKSVLLDMVGKFKSSGAPGTTSSSARSQNLAAEKLRSKAKIKGTSGPPSRQSNRTANDIRKKFQRREAEIDTRTPQDESQTLDKAFAPLASNQIPNPEAPDKSCTNPLCEAFGSDLKDCLPPKCTPENFSNQADTLDNNANSDDEPTLAQSDESEAEDNGAGSDDLPLASTENPETDIAKNLNPEGKPRRAGVAMCIAKAKTAENNQTDKTYALVHTATGTTLQDIHGRGLRRLVYEEVEPDSAGMPSCRYSPTDGYESGGYYIVLKSVMKNYAKEENVTYALGFGLSANEALTEGIAEMKRRNWSWLENAHGYTVERKGQFD